MCTDVRTLPDYPDGWREDRERERERRKRSNDPPARPQPANHSTETPQFLVVRKEE